MLVAVGRRANGDTLELDAAGVEVDERGEIAVDEQRRTNVAHIYAIGDLTGAPMLAHKASHEGVVAAEVIAGQNVAFDPRAIPSVAYTDPEVAWTGLTETEAVAAGTDYEKAVFPWQASGRALSLGRPEGLTKLLVDPESRRVLGVGHRRTQRRRADRRGDARDRDGRRRRGPRPHDPRAPDPVGDGDVRRRDGRGHDHRPLRARSASVADGRRARKGDSRSSSRARRQQAHARRVAESKATVPHVYFEAEAEAGRRRHAALVAPRAVALREFPRLNGAYRDGRFELYSRINIGVAIAAEPGLLYPTIHDADSKAAEAVDDELAELREADGQGEITQPELSGGTFSLADLSPLGIARADSSSAAARPASWRSAPAGER